MSTRDHIVVLGASLPDFARVKNTVGALQALASVTVIKTPLPDKPYRLSFVVALLNAFWRAVTLTLPITTRYVVVLFPDNENVWTAIFHRLLHRCSYKIVFDPFISIYDTYLYNKPLGILQVPVLGSLMKWWLYWYEKLLFSRADILLTDTDQHGTYFKQLFGIKKTFHTLLLAADETVFHPSKLADVSFWQEGPLRVLWYGHVSLMHGTDYIIQALQLLPADRIQLTLVGNFSHYGAALLEQLQAAGKLRYIPITPGKAIGLEKIASYVQSTHVCLGLFGHTKKSFNVIANKECEALASGRCLVTMQASREYLVNERNCIMVDQHDPRDLVRWLLKLDADRVLTQRIARQGHNDYQRIASRNQLTKRVQTILAVS